MDRVTPPESLDWFDAVMGIVVLAGGSAMTAFAAGVLTYW